MHHNIWKPTVCCNWAGLSKAVARMCSLSGDNTRQVGREKSPQSSVTPQTRGAGILTATFFKSGHFAPHCV